MISRVTRLRKSYGEARSPFTRCSRSLRLGEGQVEDPEPVEGGVAVRWAPEEAQFKDAGQACPGLDPGYRNRIRGVLHPGRAGT